MSSDSNEIRYDFSLNLNSSFYKLIKSEKFSSSENNCLFCIIYWPNKVWITVFVFICVYLLMYMEKTYALLSKEKFKKMYLFFFIQWSSLYCNVIMLYVIKIIQC